MKKTILFLSLAFSFILFQAQNPKALHFHSVGLNYTGGVFNYFGKYGVDVFLNNLNTGIPVREDWDYYGPVTKNALFWQVGGNVQFATEGNQNRVRLEVSYARKVDSLLYLKYRLPSVVNDTIDARFAVEKSGFINFNGGFVKSTKTMFNFLVLYGCVGVELGIAPKSLFDYSEFLYDQETREVISEKKFRGLGKFKIALLGQVALGFELNYKEIMGVKFEVRSGPGLYFTPRGKVKGISKIQYVAGLNLFLDRSE